MTLRILLFYQYASAFQRTLLYCRLRLWKKNVGWFTVLILQLSKAGLDIPEELSLFKRSSDKKISENSDIVEQILPAEFVEPAKSEDPCRELKHNMKNDSMKAMECQPKMDVEVSIPDPKTEGPSDNAHLLANQKIQPSIPSCSGSELDLQVINIHCAMFSSPL